MRLSLLNKAYSHLQHDYQKVGRLRKLSFEQLSSRLRVGIAGSELHATTESLQQSIDRQAQLKVQMEALEIQVRKQTEIYLESQKQCKILERLRERELRAYKMDESRREQQRIDDLFVQRWRFQTGG